MTELKPCPFCGNDKLKIDKKSVLDGYNGLGERVDRHTYSVRCNICYARGPTVGGRIVKESESYRFTGLPVWATTDEVLKELAVDAWNERLGENKRED